MTLPQSFTPPTTDTRVVFGVRCAWWDTIDKVAKTDRNLPCCPHCGSVLLEVPDLNTWWAGVDLHESEGHPAYRAFIEWLRGRCYPNLIAAKMAFDLGDTP